MSSYPRRVLCRLKKVLPLFLVFCEYPSWLTVVAVEEVAAEVVVAVVEVEAEEEGQLFRLIPMDWGHCCPQGWSTA